MYKLTILLLLAFQVSFSQESVANDSMIGIVKYELIKPSWEGNAWKPKSYNSELQFNFSESIFFYNKLSMLDNEESKAEFSEKGFAYKAISADEEGYQIYRNFETNEIFFRVPKTIPLDPFSVEDDWVEIDWQISKGIKNILGYSCQKAIGNFRGRTYTVWFTKEITTPYGPWKLFGLPGLILEAEDTFGRFKFIAKKVCYPCKIDENIDEIIEMNHKTLREYVYYNDNLLKMVEKNMKSTLDSIRKTRKNFDIEINLNNPPTEKEMKQKRKDKIEVIYEWENEKNNPTFIKSSGIKD